MRRAALAFALLALLFSVPLLADDVRLQAGSMVPAAEGVVSLGHDSNGNVVYELNTAHLAQPTSLTPAKNYYVIWLKPRDGEMQNAGTLTVNPDKLEGK